ncbi:MAG: 3-coathanger stack domain-containing protein, partial [Bacteroidota bacterium]
CTDFLEITQTLDNNNEEHRVANVKIELFNELEPTSNSSYHAGEEVILNPGFHAMNGAESHIFIEGCESYQGKNKIINYTFHKNDKPKNSSLKMSYYPNPVKNNVSFESVKEISKLAIYDNHYRIVHNSTNINTNSLNLNLNFLNKGNYLVKVVYSDNTEDSFILLKD